jgi:hypothetical protein
MKVATPVVSNVVNTAKADERALQRRLEGLEFQVEQLRTILLAAVPYVNVARAKSRGAEGLYQEIQLFLSKEI